MDKNPFSLYDFLGYFIPGAFALFLIIFSQNQDGIFKYFSLKNIEYLKNEVSIIYIVFFIIIAYTFGHVLSYLSSLFIEKYTTLYYGYPSKNLMKIKVNKKERKSYCILQKFIMILVILPLTTIDFIINNIFCIRKSYCVELDKPYRKSIQKKLNRLFNNNSIKLNITKNDFHKYLIHYCYENSSSHQHKLMNYVALYGFLRVITFILNCYCYYLIYNLTKYEIDFQNGKYYPIIVLIFFITLTFISFLAYLKFYRRYSQENLMLLLIIKEEKR